MLPVVVDKEQEIDGFFMTFPFFSSEEKKRIFEDTVCRVFKKGETVFNEGQPPKGLVCLTHGKVKVYRKGVSGKEQIVRLAKPWSLVGFQAYLSGDTYIASAKALEPSALCLVQHDCVSYLLRSNTIFANALLQYVSRALKFADLRLISLTQKHIEARLADSLIMLAETYGLQDDGQTLSAVFSRDDLAKLSNMTASNATRTLAKFQKQGLIRLGERRVIHLLDIPAITSISENG